MEGADMIDVKVPDGYELIKVGETIPDGSVCTCKEGDEWRVVSGMSRSFVYHDDVNWYARPVSKDGVRCPFCGGPVKVFAHDVHKRAKCIACEAAGPIGEDDEMALRAFKRIRIDPEPLVCPCGQGCKAATGKMVNGLYQTCSCCGISGKIASDKEQAESEFRKLSYKGEK
jgi:hypothetical protein